MNRVNFKVGNDMSTVKGMTVFNKDKVNTLKQPMFFGAPLGIQRYDAYKYPVFDKLTQTQLGYFWRPEEVSLQKDRADYHTLRPEQKHIFTSNLKYQIMLDSVQGRAPGMAFIPYCSLPELESAMTVWEMMEMIHSRSYTHIIKNIYPDPSEVFDTILDDRKILDRATTVTAAYNDLIEAAQQYGTGNMWKSDWKDSPSAQWERYDLKRKLYKAIINVNILEGIRFYVSFACSFAFGELKLMEGSAKIISLIARDENQHLVLTQNIIRNWHKGDDPDMVKIAEEERDNVIQMYKDTVEEEKAWAEYLFKDGSMIGLNAKLLEDYIEWIAHKRMTAIGVASPYKVPRANPLPWTQKWISGAEVQVAPQETEISSYVIGGTKQDVSKDTFKGFSL